MSKSFPQLLKAVPTFTHCFLLEILRHHMFLILVLEGRVAGNKMHLKGPLISLRYIYFDLMIASILQLF